MPPWLTLILPILTSVISHKSAPTATTATTVVDTTATVLPALVTHAQTQDAMIAQLQAEIAQLKALIASSAS